MGRTCVRHITETRSGSTIRIAWRKASTNRYAVHFNCQTTRIEIFQTLFPSDFTFEGNRAIIFAESDAIPTDALAFCIAATLTYLRREGGKTQRKPYPNCDLSSHLALRKIRLFTPKEMP